MFWRMVVLGLVVSWPLGARAATIPPVPAENGEGFFTHDYMQVLTESATRRIAAAQERAFRQHNTPIVVVTIHRMSEYGHNGNIEAFAREWFDIWKIGTANQPGGENKGILLLVSIDDRKARIELGGDWQRKWDGHCQRIMSQSIVPFFRSGAYAEGIASGVEGLAEMAAIGPAGAAPKLLLIRLVG